MNILPPFQTSNRPWPVILCAWCGEDLNANDNLGMWDVQRDHFASCQPYLASEEGHIWKANIERS